MSYLMLKLIEEDDMGFIEQEQIDGSKAHVVDENGFISIKFQLGSVKVFGVNGTHIETVIDILVNRLDGFQKGSLECPENLEAITHLLAAKEALQSRTKKRVAQGVEGLNEQHQS